MLPIFNTFRSGNITKSFLDSKFNALIESLKWKKIGMIIGLVLGGVLIVAFIGIMFRIRMLKKKGFTLK